jgi:hypothetical protein
VFHTYDYSANILIEVNEQLQSLDKETRLRLDNDEDSDSGSSSGKEGFPQDGPSVSQAPHHPHLEDD